MYDHRIMMIRMVITVYMIIVIIYAVYGIKTIRVTIPSEINMYVVDIIISVQDNGMINSGYSIEYRTRCIQFRLDILKPLSIIDFLMVQNIRAMISEVFGQCGIFKRCSSATTNAIHEEPRPICQSYSSHQIRYCINFTIC